MADNSSTVRQARCSCGKVTVEVTGEPRQYVLCYCDQCKTRTGSDFGLAAHFDLAQILSIEGETKVYHVQNSTNEQQRHFCNHCGTTLFWYNRLQPDGLTVAGGCFLSPPLTAPDRVQAVDRQNNWLTSPFSSCCLH